MQMHQLSLPAGRFNREKKQEIRAVRDEMIADDALNDKWRYCFQSYRRLTILPSSMKKKKMFF